NIVKMLAAQRENGHYLIVMEYVPGGTLRAFMDQQPQLPLHRVISIALEIADALVRAHHLNIVHRDLKPENVLLAGNGTPRLTDFGIAYRPNRDSRLTQPGVVLGTTAYLSPEGCMGDELDTRSDVWSFGVMLFEMLAGHNPFAAENWMATLMTILTHPVPDIKQSRPDTPAPIATLLGQMLVKERGQRMSSMRQIAAELEQVRGVA
ncbi:MAG TPA: serine/threonine-protein kinase, partial [Anaerolineales bacterium]|nr:serine/threonine-protein kinase [Anaerolineales bacterium]